MTAFLYTWGGLLITTPILYFAIFPALRSWFSHKTSSQSLDSPIYICLILGYSYSLYAIFFSFAEQKTFFELILVILFVWYGVQFVHLICQQFIHRRINQFKSLSHFKVKVLQKNGSIQQTDLRQVVCGQKLVVEPQDYFPLDGIILEGATQVDNALLTGKSERLAKSCRDTIQAGMRNVKNTVVVMVTSTFEKSSYARQCCQSPLTHYDDPIMPSEPITLWHPIFVLTLVSVITCWWLPYDTEFSLFCAVSSLLIACPLTLAIAYPLTCICGLMLCAKRGIYVKKSMALLHFSQVNQILLEETLAQPNTIAFFQRQDLHPITLSDPTQHASPMLTFSPVLWDIRYAPLSEKRDLAYSHDHLIKTLMVGQSMQAAQTLKRATIGLCQQDADPYAMLSSDIVYTTLCSQALDDTHTISKLTRKHLQQNVLIALVCNLGLLPFTAMGLLAPGTILIGLLVSVFLITGNIARLFLKMQHAPLLKAQYC